MTDAEKMLQTVLMMGAEASQQLENQCDMAAQTLKMAYDSYIRAGFTPKMAFELTKVLLSESMKLGVKK